jgi:hypothetical protein
LTPLKYISDVRLHEQGVTVRVIKVLSRQMLFRSCKLQLPLRLNTPSIKSIHIYRRIFILLENIPLGGGGVVSADVIVIVGKN